MLRLFETDRFGKRIRSIAMQSTAFSLMANMLAQAILLNCVFSCVTAFAQDNGVSGNVRQDVTIYTAKMHALDHNGAPQVRTRLNDTVNADLVVDTGSSSALLSRSIVNSLGVKTFKVKRSIGSSSGEESDVVDIDSVDFDGAASFKTAAYVMDSSTSLLSDKGVDGLISGVTFIDSKIGLMFDFKNQAISFILNGNFNDAQLKSLGFSGGTRSGIPLIPDDEEEPSYFYLPVRVVGSSGVVTDGKCLLDTGAFHTTLFMDPAPLKEDRIRRRPTQGFDGMKEMDIYPTQSVSAGAESSSAANTSIKMDVGFIKKVKRNQDATSLLGIDYLSHFKVLIDYPARKLYLEPVPCAPGVIFPTEASRVNAEQNVDDVFLKPDERGVWAVTSLKFIGGSFTRLGLKPGDILVAVNGTRTDGMLQDSLAKLLVDALESGKRPKIDILRNGSPQSL